MRYVSQVLVILVAVFGVSGQAVAQVQFETAARYALLVDHESGTVLFQENADEPMEPASMAKLMTIAVVFNELRSGRLSLDTELFVSENAWRRGGAASGGSTMFAELNSRISVENLLRSVIIQSGNDASIILAEGIAGTESTFALMMNELAAEIGLTGSHFTNSTGLPDPDMYVTARDLATLARYLIREFPEYYHIFSEPEFEWNNIKQSNRNSLVEMGIGVDGLKTGHTEAAGYGSVVSTDEGGRRLIAVVHGLDSMNQRTEEARKLITWGTRAFERIPAFAAGQIIGYADVYGGEDGSVGLIGEGSVDLYLPRGSRRCLTADITYQGPLLPPVATGERVAELRVYCNEQLIQAAPLYAADDVKQGGIVRRATDAIKQLALGWL
ncbi:D-alanyl-D-alanine carboxypeptidase family protein [Devosia nitrariae]|uniref:serine-type D-Ala-D-Ala carboxypeptidase n=1 Tax=Devosia nitrariae TaxID=2071872 RepID=A0ABQ5WDA3_9HYPH|nr:D-alanyl-D-alanine carboxypeptidase family protein [Devosia nitrariae]GLQ57776.1 D-alanyl-D-alanine carboxypeptidase [Devosia nitrariae]